ncbi:hypothetical protein BC6307_07630 [Sutcliffiella cohnii]|uniref:DUF3784 domain-containing protein n=1 Tax=Sutcliffiella cohnii TaxID=33932 RepID=A0A223KP37_9BACI|nr:hypothetical protein [Sutcliffiella cohnii]AST91157.1 hypothetical protein BC6307_07630 [Sutcliffiella cohnii]
MDISISSIILSIILLIPLYGVLIWTYIEPEESLLFGKRWMYNGEIEPSTKAIRYTKFSTMTVMIGLPIVIFSFLTKIYILRLSIVVLFVVLVIGAINILNKEDE